MRGTAARALNRNRMLELSRDVNSLCPALSSSPPACASICSGLSVGCIVRILRPPGQRRRWRARACHGPARRAQRTFGRADHTHEHKCGGNRRQASLLCHRLADLRPHTMRLDRVCLPLAASAARHLLRCGCGGHVDALVGLVLKLHSQDALHSCLRRCVIHGMNHATRAGGTSAAATPAGNGDQAGAARAWFAPR